MKDLYGQWCLIAGAAEGIGKAFANALAGTGFNVILVDHKKPEMHALAAALQQRYGIRSRTLHQDLAAENAPVAVMHAIRETGCRLMVYNAAYSKVQPFLDNTQEDLARYVQVNVHTPLQLCHAFCRHHASDVSGRKGIILMSSMAGLWGTRLLAPYGATKAFNHILAESMYYEMHEQGIDVLACIAGATATPGYRSSGPRDGGPGPAVMTPGKVVHKALRALGKKPSMIPGFGNRIAYTFLTHLLPRRVAHWIMVRSVAQRYRHLL